MKHLVNFFQSLNLTLCMAAGMLVALGVVLGMMATVRKKRVALKEAEGKVEDEVKGKVPWPGRPEVWSIVVFGVLAVGLMLTVLAETKRELRESAAIRNYERGYEESYLVYSDGLARAVDIAAQRVDAGRQGMDPAVARAEELVVHLRATAVARKIPEELTALLKGVRPANFFMRPLAWFLWLVLGCALFRAERMFSQAGSARMGMAARSRGFSGVAVGLLVLTGLGIYQAGKADWDRYEPWAVAKTRLEKGEAKVVNNGVRESLLKACTELAEEREARLGYIPISQERKEAFLKATAGLPKANVRVVQGGVPGKPRATKKQREADEWRVRVIQALIYQAGYGGLTTGLEPEQVVRPLAEALRECGIAPDARFSPAGSWSDVAFEMVLESVPAGE